MNLYYQYIILIYSIQNVENRLNIERDIFIMKILFSFYLHAHYMLLHVIVLIFITHFKKECFIAHNFMFDTVCYTNV